TKKAPATIKISMIAATQRRRPLRLFGSVGTFAIGLGSEGTLEEEAELGGLVTPLRTGDAAMPPPELPPEPSTVVNGVGVDPEPTAAIVPLDAAAFLPESISRFNRFRSARISPATW